MRLRSSSGSELVEFALVMPMLLIVVFGIVDVTLLFNQYLTITDVAREGARVAILPGYQPSDAQAWAQLYLDKTFLPTGPMPTIQVTPGQSTIGSHCVPTVTVQVSVPTAFITPLWSLLNVAGPGRLTASSTMRSEAGSC